MKLDRADIIKEIKGLEARKNIFVQQDFLDFIGRKCIGVLEEVTQTKAIDFFDKEVPEKYAKSHIYETEITGKKSFVKLSNIAVNQFGEYISAYIEHGTGVFSEQSSRPDGWIYPTTEYDKNTNKRTGKWGNLVAFTQGQKAKNIYHDSMSIIEARLDDWIEEYMKGG